MILSKTEQLKSSDSKQDFIERKKNYYDKAKQMPDYFSEGSILSENIFWKLFFPLAALLSNQRY